MSSVGVPVPELAAMARAGLVSVRVAAVPVLELAAVVWAMAVVVPELPAVAAVMVPVAAAVPPDTLHSWGSIGFHRC